MSTLDSFYTSSEWIKLVQVLKLERETDNGIICEHCGKPIVKKYDCIAHHIVELTEDNVTDPNVALNPKNIILIHFKCHNEIHKRYTGYVRRNVFLVYGAPCSGKTTWVQNNASEDDLIIDVDALWEAVTISDKYHKNNKLRQNVLGLRDALIDQVRTRLGQWSNAYVIGGYPLRSDRDRLCALLGARPIFIQEDIATCKNRASSAFWSNLIDEWFRDFIE